MNREREIKHSFPEPSQMRRKDNQVKFRDLIHDIQARLEMSSVERKTKKALRSYRNSGALKYPRLYGYRQTPNGIELIENEAKIVRLILQLLSDDKSIREIKRLLDARNLRGRSGNRFALREIIEMPKAIYAGMIRTRSGRWVRSAYYEPLVDMQTLRSAQKAIRRLSEGRIFAFPALDRGVFLTLTG
jgi:hypothetical protein